MRGVSTSMYVHYANALRSVRIVIAILFVSSLMLPVIIGGDESKEGLRSMSGWNIFLMGWFGIFIGQYSWYANICASLALFIHRRKARARMLFAAAALLLGLQTVFFNYFASLFGFQYVFADGWRWGLGYYVWMCALFLVGIVVAVESLYLNDSNGTKKTHSVKRFSADKNDFVVVLKLVGHCFVVFFAFIVIALMASVIENNMHARAMQKWVEKIEHPTSSRHIKGEWVVANFGNSNHCDWAGAEFRMSTSSRRSIKEFYKPYVEESYKKAETSFEVFFPDEEIQYGPSEVLFDELKHLASTSMQETAYLLLAIDAMHPAGEDIRCH